MPPAASPPSATPPAAAPPVGAIDAPASPPAGPPLKPNTPGDNAVLSAAFEDLGNYLGENDIPPAKPSAEGVKPQPQKKAEPTQKTEPQKTEPKPDATKPPQPPEDDSSPEKMSPKALRAAHQRLSKKIKDLETQLAEKSKAVDTPKDDPEKKALQERLERMEKQNREYEEKMKFSDFEQTDEYKQKYWEPFLEVYDAGRQLAMQLSVTVNGEERQGTPEDFDNFVRITDPVEASKYAADAFGVAAAEMLSARREVLKANQNRVKAIERYKTEGAEREKQKQSEIKQQMEKKAQTFHSLNKEAADKFPQWFKPTEGDNIDPKANELLEKGMQAADALFSNAPMDEEKMVKFHSAMRNKAGAFDRVAYDLIKATARIKELEAKVEEYENSAHPVDTRRSSPAESDEMNWEARMDKLAE